jgi:hypothetical protein
MKREELERAYAEATEEARVAARTIILLKMCFCTPTANIIVFSSPEIGQQLLEKNEENLRTIRSISLEVLNRVDALSRGTFSPLSNLLFRKMTLCISSRSFGPSLRHRELS